MIDYSTRPRVFFSLYSLVLASLLLYSYALVDPNLTFINHPLWTTFRNVMVQLGYYQRELSWNIYAILVVLLFGLHFISLNKNVKISPIKLSIFIGTILLLSYPFLSKDLFNYMFDAKILTVYGDNPYLHKALDYPNDPWLRFMHWTHRTYPYGPTFLLFTLIPSFLGFGKLLLTYIGFKLAWVGMYILGVWSLSRMDSKNGNQWAMFFATHPVVILEGLVNTHNDLWAVTFGLYGVYILTTTSKSHRSQLQKIYARIIFLISGGIKFFTLPLVLLQDPHTKSRVLRNISNVSLITLSGLLLFASMSVQIQQWYFLNFFILIPYFFKYKNFIYATSMALLLSYYPLIAHGSWGNGGAELMKVIIVSGLLIDFGRWLHRSF